MKIIVMEPSEFFGLLEYSHTLPTGIIIGKRWRAHSSFPGCRPKSCFEAERERRDCGHWFLGEYVESKIPEHVDIVWRPVILASVTPPKLAVTKAWCPEED